MEGFAKTFEDSYRGWRIMVVLNDSFSGRGFEVAAMVIGGARNYACSAQAESEQEAMKQALVQARSLIEQDGHWVRSLTCWKCGQGEAGTTVLRRHHVAVPDGAYQDWVASRNPVACPSCGSTNTELGEGSTWTGPAYRWDQSKDCWVDFGS